MAQERDASHCVPLPGTKQNNRQERKGDLPKEKRSTLDTAGNTLTEQERVSG